MAKFRRKVIQIDDTRCNGCGLCIPACPEGALQIIEGKARLVKEQFCDGLGACLGDCPEDALHIVEMEAEYYDADGVAAELKQKSPELLAKHHEHLNEHNEEIARVMKPAEPSPVFACPGSKMRHWQENTAIEAPAIRKQSRLRQWPVQLHLVPPGAPYFRNADIMIVADCVPFAYPNFHEDFVKDRAIAVGCPKLDDVDAYIEKISQIIRISNPDRLSVAYMEVPCCSGLVHLTRKAIELSGRDIPLETILVTIKGEKAGAMVTQTKSAK